MRNHIVICITVLFVFALGNTTAFAIPDDPEYTSIHGTACQPANLSQSINFGTNWNQRGVRNTNALGSNRFFFVVCPVVIPDEQGNTPTSAGDVRLRVIYQNRDGIVANRVSCTGYVYENGVLTTTAFDADTSAGPGPGTVTVELTNLIPTNFDSLSDSASIVCAMPPQSTINTIAMDYD